MICGLLLVRLFIGYNDRMNKKSLIASSALFLSLSCQHKPTTEKPIPRDPQANKLTYAPACERLFDPTDDKKGPSIKYQPKLGTEVRSLKKIEDLKIMEQNFLNLIVELEYSKSGQPYVKQKSSKEKAALARRIRVVEPDILVGTEIATLKLAQDFANEYLTTNGKSDYIPFLIEGNDSRGIDVCIFIKKDLPFRIEFQSHRNLVTVVDGKENHLFSRDVPTMLFYPIDSSGAKKDNLENQPLFALLPVHFKSMRTTDPADPDAVKERTRQVEGSADLILELEKNYPGIAIAQIGDFNNSVSDSPEFNSLKQIGLKNAFDVAGKTVPPEQRGTHYYFPPGGDGVEIKELDSAQLNKRMVEVIIEAGIVRDYDENWNIRPAPKSFRERGLRASDHDGIFIIIQFQKLLELRQNALR